LALHGGEPVLRRSHFEPEFGAVASKPPSVPAPRRAAADQDAEDLRRLQASFALHGNLSRAAREAGISRQRAYRLLGERSPADLLEPSGPEARPELGGEASDVLQRRT
jgi:hypothetical protein